MTAPPDLSQQIATLSMEVRASNAETRAALAEFRAALAEFRQDVTRRFDTLIGAIADLRQEPHGHTHADEP